MVAPFNQAWMLLKQRGHELNLPPQSAGIKGMGNPQDFTDRRVDEATMARRALDNFETMGTHSPPSVSSSIDASRHLKNRRLQEAQMDRFLNAASRAEGNEQFLQEGQSELDQAILARMGQQPEADEMEAMGVPPMSRTMGGTPPANIGRAGSTGEIPRGRQSNMEQMGGYGMDDVDDAGMDLDLNDDASPAQRQQLIDRINENIEPFNPFPKPIEQNVRGDLMDWAAGAGREAGKPGIVERTENPFEDLSEMHDSDMYDEMHSEPLHENNPAAHTIASTTLRASPRQQKRGEMDSGRAEFKRPDREGPIGMSPSQRMLQQMQQMSARKEAGF